MVNINNANNQGISANYYKDFNVDNQNLILNNYKGESVNTNLGGVIYGNPNFNVKDNNGNNVGREADIILNEITTNRVSNINGYIEVVGKKADVIIANPNGLMVGGAGFINTSRLSMITGSSLNSNNEIKSSFDSNGNLNPFLLTDTNQNPNAIIQVVGQNVFDKNGNPVAYNLGIDAKDVKYADLISRVIKLNGNIVGSDNTEVNIKTGNDKAQYNKNTGFAVSSKTDNNSEKPEFAIDSTAFGGIYAGRIKFIATEDGVGVRTRSDLIASVDDIDFDVNGNIILEEEGSLQAKRNVNLDNVNNTSNNPNKTNANNQNDREIINNSVMASENDINIKSNNLINNTENSKLYALNDINIIDVNTIDNSNNGTINAGNNVNIFNSILMNNSSNGVINAGNILNISNNDTLNNQSGSILSNNKIEINSNNLNNSNNGYIYSSNDLYINILNNLDNSNNAIIEGDGSITIISKNIDNTNGTISSTATNTASNTNTNTNNTRNSTTRTLPTNQTQNSNSSSTPILSITSQNSLNNNNGNIKSNGDITINIDKDYNINGTLYSNSSININAKNITNNSDVISANDIIFNAIGNIINGSASNLSTIIAMNDLTFNISKDTSTTNSANTTGNLYNYGKISANNDLTINAEDSIYNGLVDGSDALISGNNSVNLTAQNRLINKAFIQAVGKTDSYGNKIENTGKLNITTNAEVNDDYKLNENSTTSEDLEIKVDTIISAEAQAKLDNLDNINDLDELTELLQEIKTSQQYYKVQDRIVIVKIKEEIADLQEIFTFNVDDWKIGNTITIYEEDPNDPDNDIERQVPLTEDLFQEMLSSALGNNYVESDWDISDKVAEIESEADTKIAQQQSRFEEYNATEKAKAEEEYKQNNNDSLEGFNWVDYTMEQYINNNPTIETEGLLVKEELIQAPLNQVYQDTGIKPLHTYLVLPKFRL